MPNIEKSRTDRENKYQFIIDLSSEVKFDPMAFDLEIRRVATPKAIPGKFESSSKAISQAKFIVVGDRMILFPQWREHTGGLLWAKEVFPDVDLGGELQCAGCVDVIFVLGAFGTTYRSEERIIYDYSVGFYYDGTLAPEKSDEYKQSVLKEKLGDYFTIK